MRPRPGFQFGFEPSMRVLADLFRCAPVERQRSIALRFLGSCADALGSFRPEADAALARLRGGLWADPAASARLRELALEADGEYLTALWKYDERDERIPADVFRHLQRKRREGAFLNALSDALSGTKEGPEEAVSGCFDVLEEAMTRSSFEAQVRQLLGAP